MEYSGLALATMLPARSGPARWMRGLIKPEEGWGVAYVDYAAQEIAVAAALSGDQRLADAYATGDPYLAFAKDARLVPES